MSCSIGLSGSAYTPPSDPDAESYKAGYREVGATRRALDGTLNSCWVALKRTWHAEWGGLTAAQKDSLMTELNRLSNLSWTPPEGTTYTVRCTNREWQPQPDASTHCRVVCDLEEV
jgi:hypothetical protein